ncbi:Aminopeptidase N [Trachymyrmex cornetzi]|uniref:Aminopeptidase n=1 Tax=Trachymyrmex cornetzi TaxID=471704 RepID=A0A151JBH1_9HYME|nr:Aminopeptidase N [Trachymyrmex cornetzi]
MPVHYTIKLAHIHQCSGRSNVFCEEILGYSSFPSSFPFFGEISTTINILQSTQYIRMHQINLTLINRNITLTKDNGIIYVLNKYKYNYKTNILEFPLSYILLAGLYTFKTEFYGDLKENHKSIYKYFYKGNRIALLFAPHIQANGVRQLFPCWDEPHLKATFNIAMKHSRYHSVLSNMPTKFITLDEYNNLLCTYFDITPPISTFQVAIVVTNYNYIKIKENITLWLYSSEQSWKLKSTQRIINDITLHLKSEFGGINIPKMDHLLIPNFSQDGTSKWGLIFHTEANLIYDEQTDSVMHKIEVARLIAPKIAYQWFSNVFSYNWWTRFWLHDGLATLFGEETIVKIFNDSKIMDFFIVQNQYESLYLDSHFDLNPQIIYLLEIDSLFSFPRHLKVLIVLRMLQSAITDKVFRNNVHIYVNRNTFSSMISIDFWSMQEPIEAFKCFIPNNLIPTWITYRHYPIVYFEQDEVDSYKGRLSQMYNLISQGRWWIPINLKNYKLQIGKTLLTENFTTCLTPDSLSFSLNVPQIDWTYDWIVNIQRAGYYRIKYGLKGWHAIANYLNSTAGEYEGISVINRAKIIDDAFHLIMEHQLNVSIFWNLTQFLSQETNYVVWYPMIKVFEYMSTIFPYSKDEIKFIDIKEKFKNLLKNPLKTLGYDEHQMENDLTKCLRQEFVKWACTLEYDECEQAAFRKLQQHLQNPEINPLLPGWKHWTYCRGLTIANWATWSHLKDIWLETRNYTLLSYLTCSGYASRSIASSLVEIFTQDERRNIRGIRSYIDIFHSIVMKHSKTNYIFEKILTVLETFKPEQINILTALVDIINHVYSSESLGKVNKFSTNYMYKVSFRPRVISVRLILISVFY